jgi:glycosyltransferase involved in cell wall biosynthesis
MDILYYGYFAGDGFSEEIKKLTYYHSMVGALYFCQELALGFDENKASVSLCSLIPYRWRETKQIFFHRESESYRGKYKVSYLSFINLAILQEISYIFSSISQALRWAKKTKGSGKRAVLIELNNYLPVVLGNMIVCKLKGIHLSTYMHDANIDLYNDDAISRLPQPKRSLIRLYLKAVTHIEKNFDSYVYIAQGMNEVVNKKSKPHITIGGIYNSNDLSVEAQPKYNAIMYAGSLHRKYGIEKILDVFEGIDDPSLQLWICGMGEVEQEVREAAKRDVRITYFGFLPRDEVLRKERSARLLVNMRNPSLGYTKRSFPGKVMEYMVSGTPLLSTKIRGITDAFYQHIYHIDGYDTTKIRDALLKTLSKPDNELRDFGKGAREFVINNASGTIQSKKILDFLRSLCDNEANKT